MILPINRQNTLEQRHITLINKAKHKKKYMKKTICKTTFYSCKTFKLLVKLSL